MNFYEFDWLREPTRGVLAALSQEMRHLERKLDAALQLYDRDDGLSTIDSVIGVAFVLGQVYITSVVAAARKLSPPATKVSKQELVRVHNQVLPGREVFKIELCDAMANYYKHREEWAGADKAGRHQATLKVMSRAGIELMGGIACMDAMELLFPDTDSYSFSPLFSLLVNWRDAVIQEIVANRERPSA